MKIEKTKVFRVLKRLSKREKEQLRLFLASPFFNKRQDVVLLFEQLICLRKQAIVPEELFQAIYPKCAFKESDLRLVRSYLFRLVEHFLVYQQLFQADKKASHKRAAIHAYQNLHLPTLAEKSVQDYQKELEKSPSRNADYYFQEFAFFSETYVFSLTQRPSERQPFQEMSAALDTAYISFKLRQACHALSNQSAFRHEYELNMIPEIIAYVEAHHLQTNIAIGLYYYIYLTLTVQDSEAAFQKLKELLSQTTKYFPHRERRDIYLMLINHYIRKLNKEGIKQAAYEIFELYKEGLQSDSLLENNTLSRFTYSNIVSSALKVQELDWAELFMHDYQSRLGKRFQLSFFNFNMALVAYERKQLDKALQLLRDINKLDLGFELIARTLRLKIYFEQEKLDSLDSHLISTKNFINRRKKDLDDARIKNYMNIIKYTNQLLDLLSLYDKTKWTKLVANIQNEQILTEKKWLLEQLQKIR